MSPSRVKASTEASEGGKDDSRRHRHKAPFAPGNSLYKKSSIFADAPKPDKQKRKHIAPAVPRKKARPAHDSDSDELIDLHTISPSRSLAPTDFSEMDRLISLPHKPKDKPTPKKLFASTLLGSDGNILSNFEREQHQNIDAIRAKYAHLPLPITSKKALRLRVLAHKHTIAKILQQQSSHFYSIARDQRQRSNHSTMSKDDNWDINWSRLMGGYYGSKRQHFISSVVMSEFKHAIVTSTDATVQYWDPHRFTTYVLANEIIVRLAMEDLACDQQEAERVVESSHDYGEVVANAVAMEDDLDVHAESKKAVLKGLEDKDDALAALLHDSDSE